MNHDNERKAFETKCKLLKYNGDMTRHRVGNFYIDQTTNWMWQMWLSSANRVGYKLVPLEATQEMVDAVYNSTLASDDLEGIYKAMIGACDDHT